MTSFLADEHIPYKSIRMLQDAGHDVLSVSTDYPSLKDEEILTMASTENRVIITCDSDFGELIFKRKAKFVSGIIYFRIGAFRPEEPAAMILRYIAGSSNRFDRRFTVITRNRIRQRAL